MENIFAAGRLGFEDDGKQAFKRNFFVQQFAYGLGFGFAEVVGLGMRQDVDALVVGQVGGGL
jgi:hypothetical protein